MFKYIYLNPLLSEIFSSLALIVLCSFCVLAKFPSLEVAVFARYLKTNEPSYFKYLDFNL